MLTLIRTIKPLVLVTMIILVLLIITTLTINMSMFDEELHPEVVELLKPTQYPADKDNGYIYFMGLLADKTKEPEKIGAEYVKTIAQFIESEDFEIDSFAEANFPTKMAEDIMNHPFSKLSFRCENIQSSCLDDYAQQFKKSFYEQTNIEVLLNRYQHLITFSTFVEKPSLRVKSPLPSFKPVYILSKLYLAKSYQESTTVFIDAIGKDLRFWRMVLRQSQTLIAKLVAARQVENDFQLISFLLKEKQLSAAEFQSIAQLLTPLTQKEKSIEHAFKSEFSMIFDSILNSTDEELSIFHNLAWIVTQRQASVNHMYRHYFVPYLNGSNLNTTYYYQEVSKCSKLSSCIYSNTDPGGFSLYNPYGRILVSFAMPAYEDYIGDLHEVATYIDLVRLQLEINRASASSPDMIVNQSSIKNPMTGKPMDIDLSTRTISYQCGDKDAKCAVSY